jgi:hypothetical protein
MTYFCSNSSKSYSFKIEDTSPELITKLDNIFLNSKDPKRIKQIKNGTIYYVYENKYSAWLAGSISIIQNDEYTIVYAPKRYKNKIESL